MVAIIPAKVPQPPFSKGYNSNATCAYHGGVPRHSIEHCMTLKHKVQNLIDVGWLKFEEDNRLSCGREDKKKLSCVTYVGLGIRFRNLG